MPNHPYHTINPAELSNCPAQGFSQSPHGRQPAPPGAAAALVSAEIQKKCEDRMMNQVMVFSQKSQKYSSPIITFVRINKNRRFSR